MSLPINQSQMLLHRTIFEVTDLGLSNSKRSFSRSLKHWSEFIVHRTSASTSSVDGITEVYTNKTGCRQSRKDRVDTDNHPYHHHHHHHHHHHFMFNIIMSSDTQLDRTTIGMSKSANFTTKFKYFKSILHSTNQIFQFSKGVTYNNDLLESSIIFIH